MSHPTLTPSPDPPSPLPLLRSAFLITSTSATAISRRSHERSFLSTTYLPNLTPASLSFLHTALSTSLQAHATTIEDAIRPALDAVALYALSLLPPPPSPPLPTPSTPHLTTQLIRALQRACDALIAATTPLLPPLPPSRHPSPPWASKGIIETLKAAHHPSTHPGKLLHDLVRSWEGRKEAEGDITPEERRIALTALRCRAGFDEDEVDRYMKAVEIG